MNLCTLLWRRFPLMGRDVLLQAADERCSGYRARPDSALARPSVQRDFLIFPFSLHRGRCPSPPTLADLPALPQRLRATAATRPHPSPRRVPAPQRVLIGGKREERLARHTSISRFVVSFARQTLVLCAAGLRHDGSFSLPSTWCLVRPLTAAAWTLPGSPSILSPPFGAASPLCPLACACPLPSRRRRRCSASCLTHPSTVSNKVPSRRTLAH